MGPARDTPLVQLLTEATRDRDRIGAELATLASRQRELKAAHKAAVKRIEDLLGDLVEPRPLLDMAEARVVEERAVATEARAIPAIDREKYPETAEQIDEYFGDPRGIRTSRHAIERRGVLADFCRRVAAGDLSPGWDRWGEWVIPIRGASENYAVRVVLDGDAHVDFHGPVSETGYRSWFASGVEGPAEVVVREAARHLVRMQGHVVYDEPGEAKWRLSPVKVLGLRDSDRKALEKEFRARKVEFPTLGMLSDERLYFGQQLLSGMSQAAFKRTCDALDAYVAKQPTQDIPRPAPDIPESAPDIPPVCTWHSVAIDRWLKEPAGLAELLIAGDLDTMGTFASFLSDGDELEDLEVPADDQGDTFRKLEAGEVRALRYTLLRFVQEQGIEGEFPPIWIDPTARMMTFELTAKSRKGEPDRKAYLRANTKFQASEYADHRLGKDFKGLREIPASEIPEGVYVHTVPLDSYEDRLAQHRLEAKAEEHERQAKAAEEKARKEPEPGLFGVTTPKGKAGRAPLYFVRARSLAEAVAYVKAERPDGKTMKVGPWFDELPKGVMVLEAKPAPAAKGA